MVIAEGLKAERPSDRHGQCISILSGFSRSFDNPYRSIVRIAGSSDICSELPSRKTRNNRIEIGRKQAGPLNRPKLLDCEAANYPADPFTGQLRDFNARFVQEA